MTPPATTRPEPAAAAAAHSAAGVWLRGTAAAAIGITALDAALLQQKKAFFTGGFLTEIHVDGAAGAVAFLTTSLLVDAGVAGLIAVAILLAFSRLRLGRRARLVLAGAGALAPLVIWDFINYSLLTYLGDAFDLGLMFDLTGRDASEVFAVASSHLVVPAALTVAAAASLAGLVWTVDRFAGSARRAPSTVSRRLAAGAAALFAAALVLFGAATAASDTIEDGLRRKASGQLFIALTDVLTDFDGDGFGIGGRTSDPAPFDGAIYPYALDVPGNGVDENAVGGDLTAADAYVERAPGGGPWARRPDVVLFVLESFRAGSVGRTVAGRPVTPVMDALAAEGISSLAAFSHNGYTTQSRFHLLTGSLAGVGDGGSLVDDFRKQGYETAYFSAQDESFGGPALGVGFERADVRYDARQDRDRRYSTFTTAGSLAVPHDVLRQRIGEFLERRDARRPLFLYVNFHDTHFPYHHPGIEPLVADRTVPQARITPGNAGAVREMYDNTAANVDRALGATVEMVTASLGRRPAVIVTADHGESLFEEGFLGHGYALNDVQTRIPLVVRGLPLEIAEPFGQADLRGAIDAALSRDWNDGTARPRVFSQPGKAVFQYLGNIHRPRQIGFATGRGRVIYDFRDRRVIEDDGREARVSSDVTGEALRLVHAWERMMLARAGR